jgi:hypothetical protein
MTGRSAPTPQGQVMKTEQELRELLEGDVAWLQEQADWIKQSDNTTYRTAPTEHTARVHRILSALSRTQQAEAENERLRAQLAGCVAGQERTIASLKERNEEVERLREALAAAEARTVAEMEYANASRNLAATFFKALSEIGGMPHYIAPIKPEHASSLHKRYEHALALAEAAVHSGGRTS